MNGLEDPRRGSTAPSLLDAETSRPNASQDELKILSALQGTELPVSPLRLKPAVVAAACALALAVLVYVNGKPALSESSAAAPTASLGARPEAVPAQAASSVPFRPRG